MEIWSCRYAGVRIALLGINIQTGANIQEGIQIYTTKGRMQGIVCSRIGIKAVMVRSEA